jgi:hypothetical protein
LRLLDKMGKPDRRTRFCKTLHFLHALDDFAIRPPKPEQELACTSGKDIAA